MEATFSFYFKVVYLIEKGAYNFESQPDTPINQFISDIYNNCLRCYATESILIAFFFDN